MRILYVADGRSPTALSWVEYFVNAGHEVHLASTFECSTSLDIRSISFVPVAFSGIAGSVGNKPLRRQLPTGFRTRLRNWFGGATVKHAARALTRLVNELKPDLVHAMRIPYEGMLAAAANFSAPLLISVWGNDFTLHGKSNPLMAAATRQVMQRADALHTDTHRDQRLAHEWGLAKDKPSIILPGNGGVRTEIFYPLPEPMPAKESAARLRVINPRGIRAYVRNDIFFQAIPQVLSSRPEARFFCPGMEGEPEAHRWVDSLKLNDYVTLMPKLSPRALADTYHSAQVMVSPSTHDGTPNSLLEAMACGVLPVASNLETICEWIAHGKNGLLCDPLDADDLASAIVRALKDAKLRTQAAEINVKIISERAD
ncbi:MAG: glycosyltransferase family 4 protein, partial [Anaerolineales bacterium]